MRAQRAILAWTERSGVNPSRSAPTPHILIIPSRHTPGKIQQKVSHWPEFPQRSGANERDSDARRDYPCNRRARTANESLHQARESSSTFARPTRLHPARAAAARNPKSRAFVDGLHDFGNRKKPSAVGSVWAASCSRDSPRQVARNRAVSRVNAGSLRSPRWGSGAR